MQALFVTRGGGGLLVAFVFVVLVYLENQNCTMGSISKNQETCTTSSFNGDKDDPFAGVDTKKTCEFVHSDTMDYYYY